MFDAFHADDVGPKLVQIVSVVVLHTSIETKTQVVDQIGTDDPVIVQAEDTLREDGVETGRKGTSDGRHTWGVGSSKALPSKETAYSLLVVERMVDLHSPPVFQRSAAPGR